MMQVKVMDPKNMIEINNNNDYDDVSSSSFLSSKRKEADEIVSKLTLMEKIKIISGKNLWTLKSLPSITTNIWLCDGPHGIRKQLGTGEATNTVQDRVRATCFPTSSSLANSWDIRLLYDVGTALRRECLAHQITVLLGPGINLIRDPRGGRSFEYFSEDVVVTARLATALVRGIQQNTEEEGNVGVCIKHFYANNQETHRFVVDTIIDERTLQEMYLYSFHYIIQKARPWAVMCAYNRVNGKYCTEDDVAIYKTIRQEGNYDDIVVMTDWGATNDRLASIRAECDLEMPGSHGAWDDAIVKAIRLENNNDDTDKLSLEQHVTACATRVAMLMLAGQDMMQRQASNPTIVDYQFHHQLAREAAQKSIVLLKNGSNLLPLHQSNSSSRLSIAVVGKWAKHPRYQGMGSSQVLAHTVDSAYSSLIRDYYPDNDETNLVEYYCLENNNNNDIEEVIQLAEKKDILLLFCGLQETDESEGFDRETLNLPQHDIQLLESIFTTTTTKRRDITIARKTIVIISNGAPVILPPCLVDNDNNGAILETFLAGQAAGSAIIDIIFGAVTPSAKLAQTIPKQLDRIPSYQWFPGQNHQVQYREGLRIGYRAYDTDDDDNVQYPFGHGLSYTTFEYKDMNVSTIIHDEQEFQVKVTATITNIGQRAGAEIVQCYIKYSSSSAVYRPYHELGEFYKTNILEPNGSETITILLDKHAFAFWDVGVKDWVVEAPMEYTIQLAASSRDIRQEYILRLDHPTGRQASTEARERYPPSLKSDDDFERMLGHDIPPPPSSNNAVIHRNTLLEDLQHTFFGRTLKRQIVRTMLESITDETERTTQAAFAEAAAGSIPLRTLVLFSRGALTFSLLDWIISLMNGHYLTFLYRMPGTISGYLWAQCFGNRT